MSNDLQASISTNTGRTSAEIQRLQGTIASLKGEVDQLNKKCNDFQEKASRSFGHVNKEAQEMSKEMREGGHVMHMLGGDIGMIGERLGSLSRVTRGGSGAMMAMGGAATIAGIAFESYTKYMELSTQATEAAIAAEEKHYQAVMKSKEAAQKVSVSGGPEAETHRKMLGAIGPGGSYDAHQIAGDIHADIGDVEKGLIETAKIPKSQRQAVIDAAKKAYLAGAGSFSEAISVGVDSPAVRGLGAGSELAGALVQHKMTTGHFGGASIKQLRQSIRDVQGNDATIKQNQITDLNNEAHDSRLLAFTNQPGAVSAAALAAGATKNPANDVMLEAQRNDTESNEHLRKISESNERMAGLIKVLTDGFLGKYLARPLELYTNPSSQRYYWQLADTANASDGSPSASQ